MKDKRAYLVEDPMVIVILASIVLVIMIILFINIFGVMQEEADREGCKQSLVLSSFKLEGLIDKYGNPVKLNCKTDYLTYKTQNDEEIKRIIADKMVDCWNMYLKGEKEIFNTKDNTYCAVCSRLEFEKKTELPQFSDYLNTNRVSHGGMTYFEYLSGVNVENFQKILYDNTDLGKYDTLSTKEPLAVVFVMGKEAYPGGAEGVEGTKVITTPEGALIGGGAVTGVAVLTVIGTAIAGAAICSTGIGCVALIAGVAVVGAGAGGGIGYLVGGDRTADWDARILVYPYDQLSELQCTYLESQSVPLQIKPG